MSYNQNPMFVRPPSQGYPQYGGPGMASGKSPAAAQPGQYKQMYVVQGSPYMNQQIYPPGTEGSFPGGVRAGADANAAQVMVGMPMYQGQYMQPGSGMVGNAPQMMRPLQVYQGGHIPLGTPAQSHPTSYSMAIAQQQPQQQQGYYKGYMQPPHVPQQQQQQQQQQLPSAVPAASIPKRKRNLIQIIDPNTGQEVNLTAAGGGQENKTSTNDVEPAAAASAAMAPTTSIDMGAQFAAQVAATLDPVTPRENKTANVRVASAAVTAAPKLPSSSEVEAAPSERAPATGVEVGQNQLESSSTVEAPEAVVPTSVAPTQVVPTTVVPTPVAPTTVVPTTVAPTTVVPTSVVPTPVAPAPVETASLATSGTVPSDVENKAVCDGDEAQESAGEVEPDPTADSLQPEQTESSGADDELAKTKASSKTIDVKTSPPPQQVPSQPQQQSKPIVSAGAASETTADNNGNKKKNRKKNKDLNTKGKVLQGSDMDAFIDEASKSDSQKAKLNAGNKSLASKSSDAADSEVTSEPETSAQNVADDETQEVAEISPDLPPTTPADPCSAADITAVSGDTVVSDVTVVSESSAVADSATVVADTSAVVTDDATDSVAVADTVVAEKTSLPEAAEKREPVEKSVVSGDAVVTDRASVADVDATAAVTDTRPATTADDVDSSSPGKEISEKLPTGVEKTGPAAGLGGEEIDVKTFQAVLANDEGKEAAETVANDDAESGSSGSGTEMESGFAGEGGGKPDLASLKYKYSLEQWSPLNPEGKKQYDRNFMLQLQFVNPSIIKPVGLPPMLDIILNEPRGKAEGFSKQLSIDPMSPVDFTPGFIKQSLGGGGGGGGGGNRGPPRRGGQGGGGGGGGGQGGGGQGGGMKRSIDQQQPQRKIITIEHNITLHTTQNAWKPVASKAKETEELSTEDLYKKIRGILNKLTPQKFATLIQKVQDLPIDTEERLTGCINIIFEKAISEPNFSVAYANMAKCLINITVTLEADPSEKVGFRKLLLNKCQQEFEKDKAEQMDIDNIQSLIDEAKSDEKRKQLTDQRNDMMSRAKRRSLGNIRFIGELFRLKMLTEKIMHECLGKLLRISNDEDSLECLCQLLRTIGIDIDKKQQSQVFVNKYFTELQGLVDNKKTSARLRFMILDVIDLRKNQWIPRRDNNNPKTIEQIHKEAEQESQDKQMALQKFNQEQRGRGGRGPPPRAGPVSSGGSHVGDDGWTAVGRAPKSIVDPARMKLTKQPMDENVQLGPGGKGMSAWSRGSSGGLKTLSQESDRPMPTPNRFSALGGFGSESMDARSRPGGRGAYTGRLSGPQGRGPVSRQSQEKASNEMSYRSSVAGRAVHSPAGSRSASQEIRSARDKASSAEHFLPPTPKEEKEVSEAEVEKKTKALMEEYLHGHDIKEAALCVKELGSKSLRHFVYHSLLQNLERTTQARNFTGKLHLHLVKTKQMRIEHYVEGLRSILEFADEMVIDIPLIWVYLGELISPMVEDGTVSLAFLRAACEPLVACDKAGVVLGQVLHETSRVLGNHAAAELWKKSGLRWTDFMKPDAVESFIANQKLEFLEESASSSGPTTGSSSSLSMEQLQEQLTAFLTDSKSDKEKLHDWISERVTAETSQTGSFIRAFTTSICSGCLKDRMPGQRPDESKVDKEKLKEYANALSRFIKHEPQLEMQTLYATQSFVHKLEHPPAMLLDIWTVLYDEDIINDVSFFTWKSSSEPSEAAGKGVALSSLTQFFQWIEEKEEPEKDDDPES